MKRSKSEESYKIESPELDRLLRRVRRKILLGEVKKYGLLIVFIGFIIFFFLGAFISWANAVAAILCIVGAGMLPSYIDWDTATSPIQTKEVHHHHHHPVVMSNPKITEVREVALRNSYGEEIKIRHGRKWE
jgi:hypothetical protein